MKKLLVGKFAFPTPKKLMSKESSAENIVSSGRATSRSNLSFSSSSIDNVMDKLYFLGFQRDFCVAKYIISLILAISESLTNFIFKFLNRILMSNYTSSRCWYFGYLKNLVLIKKHLDNLMIPMRLALLLVRSFSLIQCRS